VTRKRRDKREYAGRPKPRIFDRQNLGILENRKTGFQNSEILKGKFPEIFRQIFPKSSFPFKFNGFWRIADLRFISPPFGQKI